MIDVTTERLLTLAEAANLLPGRPSAATLWRWRVRGIRGKRLESVQVGAKIFTSFEALQRFAIQRGGPDESPGAAASPGRPGGPSTPSRRRRSFERAEAELAKAGI